MREPLKSRPPIRALTVNAVVRLRDSDKVGRIGLFAKDVDGQKYGLTAQHVLDGSISAYVDCDNHEVMLETPPTAQATSDGFRPMSEAITAMRVVEKIGLQNRPYLTWPQAVEPEIGDRVARLTAANEFQLGEITGLGGIIQVVSPVTGEPRRYKGYIQAAFGPEIGPLEPGAGGSLVVDADGRALGIVIAGAQDQTIIAPINAFLRKNRLSILEANQDDWTLLDAELMAFQNKIFDAPSVYDGLGPAAEAALVTEER